MTHVTGPGTTDVSKYERPTETELRELQQDAESTPAQPEAAARELRRRDDLGRVPTTCAEHAYGTTTYLSFQIKVF
jgi:hypothetical protein